MIHKDESEDPKRPREEAAVALIESFATAVPGDGEDYGMTAEEMIARSKQFIRDYPGEPRCEG